jgi:hypothetical protein
MRAALQGLNRSVPHHPLGGWSRQSRPLNRLARNPYGRKPYDQRRDDPNRSRQMPACRPDRGPNPMTIHRLISAMLSKKLGATRRFFSHL